MPKLYHMIQVKCTECLKEFTTYGGKLKTNKLGVFCSRLCVKKFEYNLRKKLICIRCAKSFTVPASHFQKHCSMKCRMEYTRKDKTKPCKTCGKIFYNVYKKVKFCSKDCYGISNRDHNNYLWGGSKTSYRSQHHWVVRRLGKASNCAHCGLKELPEGKKRYFTWANISHKYKRDTSDYMSLCMKCHGKYDSEHRKTTS